MYLGVSGWVKKGVKNQKIRSFLLRAFGALGFVSFLVAPWLLLFVSPDITHHEPSWINFLLAAVAVWLAGSMIYVAVDTLLPTDMVREWGPNAAAVFVVSGVSSLLAILAFVDWIFACSDMCPFGMHGLDRADAAYFAAATFTTAGTGTLGPVTHGARLLVTGQTLLCFAVITGLIAGVVSRIWHY